MDIDAVMDEISGSLGLLLEGEVQDLAGVLNSQASYDVSRLEAAHGVTSQEDWGYYARQVAGAPGQMLKVWVRWNLDKAVYDYYLEADAGAIFSHTTPYVGTVN